MVGMIYARSVAHSSGMIARLNQKVEDIQQEIQRIAMMTERKKKILSALGVALDYCGYDLDAIMGTKCRERSLVDIRSIVWSIYKNETGCSCLQMAGDFNWDRSTIYCSINRAEELRRFDRNYADMYDSVHGAYINALAAEEEKQEREGQITNL